MTLNKLFRIAPMLVVAFILAGCAAELGDMFEIIAYEESDDPNIRETGKVLRKIKEQDEVNDKLDQFRETGDPRFLDDARAIRPNDTEIIANQLVIAIREGDQEAAEKLRSDLATAEGRRLSSLTRPGDLPISAEQLRRNVLGEILVAQTHQLGGSLNVDWDPPPADASAERKQLYADYCATRNQIQTEHNDSLSYIPTPPCPGA